MYILRPIRSAEYREAEALTREAFWDIYRLGCIEHYLLHILRRSQAFIPKLEWVVQMDEHLVGHIAYSHMFQLPNRNMCPEIICLGPVCIHPRYQKQGMGSALIEHTLHLAASLGYKAVLLTGDPAFYARFDFHPASVSGIYLPGMDPVDASPHFMACELSAGFLSSHSGCYDFDASFFQKEGFEAFESTFPSRTSRAPLPEDLP